MAWPDQTANMFAWAEKQLERLSKTVAPVPTDGAHHFRDALAAADSASALALLRNPNNNTAEQTQTLDAHNTVLHNIKGSLPIHVASEYGNVEVVQALIRDFGVSPQQLDAQGNTPLHYATSSQHPHAFQLVQMLVNEYRVSLSVTNIIGQTPYDVCSVNRIRQWLLPIQLQRETQECLDNGGIGLPPGIDLGGIQRTQPTLAPPPRFVGPPPVIPSQTTLPPTPTPTVINSPQGPPPVVAISSAPSSANHTYARTGFSSAAISPHTAKYRPDGFHSSSSDTALQEKYNHDKNITGPPSGQTPHIHVGPPPTVHPVSTSTRGRGGGGASTWNSRPNITQRYPVYSLGTTSIPSYDPQFHVQQQQPMVQYHQPPTIASSTYFVTQQQYTNQGTLYETYHPPVSKNEMQNSATLVMDPLQYSDDGKRTDDMVFQLPPLPNFPLNPTSVNQSMTSNPADTVVHPDIVNLDLPPPPFMMDIPLSPQ